MTCFFYNLFQPPSNFEILPSQQTEPNVIILHITALLFLWTLTLWLPRCHLKTNDNNAKFEICTPIFRSRFTIWKDFCQNNIKSRFVRHRTGKYTVCRHVCGLFSPEIIRTGAVKGLIHMYTNLNDVWPCLGALSQSLLSSCSVYTSTIFMRPCLNVN